MNDVSESEGRPIMSEEEFAAVGNSVADKMGEYVRSTITPLCEMETSSVLEKVLKGTGTYIAIDGMCIILTCKHVTDEGGKEFGFRDSGFIHTVGLQVVAAGGPLDAAMMNVPEFLWAAQPHNANAVEFGLFAEKHDPVHREIFFLAGFAGENSDFVWGEHFASSSGYGSQIHEEVAAKYAAEVAGVDRYFYVLWDPKKTRVTTGSSERAARDVRFDDAKGLSGSLVWDTGWVRAYQEGRQWTPADARVTGLLTRWEQKDNVLVVRKIEDVRNWMIAELGWSGRCTI